MPNPRETVAYWLARFPGLGYSAGQLRIHLTELAAGFPLEATHAEREARRLAIEQLLPGTVVQRSVTPPSKRKPGK